MPPLSSISTEQQEKKEVHDDEVVDVAIVGAGLGGLCAGAILNSVYGRTVGIYESHYHPGGCAHAFAMRPSKNPDNVTFIWDSGPTILLGCSAAPPFQNALQQVLNVIDEQVEWIPYDGWGMIENPSSSSEVRWRVTLGETAFRDGPLLQFGGPLAVREFDELRNVTRPLLAGASIPAIAMRSDDWKLVPLLKYLPTLMQLITQDQTIFTGTFASFMEGPIYNVTSPWLKNWLDALAFSLSGLPARRTAAAAMAFVLSDLHRKDTFLDYPKDGMGSIVEALVRGVEKHNHGSKVHLKQHVVSIDGDGTRITGITLRSGKRIRARDGVICNASVWCLQKLVSDQRLLLKLNNQMPLVDNPYSIPSSWSMNSDGSYSTRGVRFTSPGESLQQSFLERCNTAEATGSFIHLHLAIHTKDLDVSKLEAHYTVMDRSLAGNDSILDDGPCGEANMIAVSNPCVLDPTLAPPGYWLLHAYAAGNEPYERWQNLDRKSTEYQSLKEKRAQPLWRAVTAIIPDVRQRVVMTRIGSPLTHERFLRRPRGSYGSATEDYLQPDGRTGIPGLFFANDGVFPGIGIPSVAIAGASAANAFVGVWEQWQAISRFK
jgi:phytoene dehydrogenase-like protein